MPFRNDEQVEMFDSLLKSLPGLDLRFFRTVVFECQVPASLRWSLSRRETDGMRAGLLTDVDRVIVDFRKSREGEIERLQRRD
jgi:hypothetical protein